MSVAGPKSRSVRKPTRLPVETFFSKAISARLIVNELWSTSKFRSWTGSTLLKL